MKKAVSWLAAGLFCACLSGVSVQQQEQVVKREPLNPDAHYLLGNAYYKESVIDDVTYDKAKLNKALSSYKKALELNPLHPEANGKIGLIHRDLGHLVQAKKQLEDAVKQNPDLKTERRALAQLYYNDGVAAIKSMDYSGGMKKLLKAKEYDPKLKEAEANLAIVYYNLGSNNIRSGNYDKGIEMLQKALQIAPGNTEAKKNLGVAYAKAAGMYSSGGELARAEEYFNLAMQYGKTDEILRNLAVVYCKKAVQKSMKKKTYPDAIALYKKAIKVCPNGKDPLVSNAQNNIKALEQRLKKKSKKKKR